MTAILTVKDVSLRFGGIVALDDVSLVIERGELMAVVGPTGAGKTSLLNCITGAYRASGGQIIFKGLDITTASPHQTAKQGISRTFQHNELFPQLTTLENLLVGRHAALNYGILSPAMYLGKCRSWELAQRQKVEEVIEFFELELYRKQIVGDLPYGAQKLISLARAFAADPVLASLDFHGPELG